MHTRRHFSGLLLATFVAGSRSSFGAPQSPVVGGVHLGLESYSLMPLRGDGIEDRWIELMHQLGFAECSAYEPLLQPRELATKLQAAREAKDRAAMDAAMQDMNKWRTGLSVSSFRDMRNKFAASGIRFAYFRFYGCRTGTRVLSDTGSRSRDCDRCGGQIGRQTASSSGGAL